MTLFNLSLDSKLRGCDLLRLKVSDIRTVGDIRNRAKITQKETGNLRAVQLLLGHTKIDSTVRCLGVEVEDALELAESTEL